MVKDFNITSPSGEIIMDLTPFRALCFQFAREADIAASQRSVSNFEVNQAIEKCSRYAAARLANLLPDIPLVPSPEGNNVKP
jgi:hypothetical protein